MSAPPRGPSGDTFSLRAVVLLIAAGLMAFTAAALVAIYSDPQTEGTYGTNAYSYSAIGHRAWTEILQDLEVPVLLSRNDSAAKAYDGGGLLILAQPYSSTDAIESMELMFDTDRVLLVLPRWSGFPGYENRTWIKLLRELEVKDVEKILHVVDEDASIVRSEETPDWRRIAWDSAPSLDGAQLIKSDTITPIVHSDAGVLLGEYRVGDTTVWVLSDPDIINNSGIDEGDNAVFAVAMVDALLQGGGAAVFDETSHGFTLSPDLWKALLSFPLNLAVLQGLFAAAILVWAAAGRFGAPLPPRPRLKAGKQVLIANTASLFEYAGNLADILKRYHETCLHDLGRHIHVPRDRRGAKLTDWLDRTGRARGTSESYSQVYDAVATAINGPSIAVPALLRAALRLHRWKQEMIHGHRADPNGLRPGAGAGSQDRGRTGRRP
ncbi:DUF4350 domain-containing protein [Pelagibius marinus]|uniref:DUF4350 domain-containing protein n=1 Tax=Pelagibius marinus TaxID=2762760 RepID=UPI0018733DBD|nr:DUF4350 domain-containing protein [Pelagibius marinus]